MRPIVIAVLAVVVAVTAGCGAVAHLSATAGNATRGEALFKQATLPGGAGCGSCHTLAAAGTQGQLGPNLDAAFGPDRCQNVGGESTIRDVVRGQIAYADSDTGTGVPGMPRNLVEGQDAKDVSAYVGQVAGLLKGSAVRATTSGSKLPYWDCGTGAEVTAG
jgi:mono/diheme cytochrome c family protein